MCGQRGYLGLAAIISAPELLINFLKVKCLAGGDIRGKEDKKKN